MRKTALLAFASPMLLAACFTQPTGAARVQEAASEMNLNTRFGRMEIAAERVSTKGRAEFGRHRENWGGKVRVADAEITGMHLLGKEELEAEVTVKVAWYRADEGELRVTTLRQNWHDYKGDWKLDAEQRVDGDVGLIGEKMMIDAKSPPREHAQFPTIRLGTGSTEPQQ